MNISATIFTMLYCLDCLMKQPVLGVETAKQLFNYLFLHKSYNRLIRPSLNITQPVRVNLGVALIQIINVEEKKQIMKANVWLRISWRDERLTWVPEDFDNITTFNVDAERVWRPGIVLFNNADGNYEASWRPNVLINFRGEILWIPPALYKSSCTLDVTYFPKDVQHCSIRLGSWTYNSAEVELDWFVPNMRHVDLSDYVESGTWDIVDCEANIVRTAFTAAVDSAIHNEDHSNYMLAQVTYTQMIYTLVLRRKALFYIVILICPCAMIAALNVCLFYLPADAGKKTTLSVSLILAVVVFLLLIRKILPPTSQSVPLISKYLLFTFMMNVISLYSTVGVISCHFRSATTYRMNPWLRAIVFRGVAPLLRMNIPFFQGDLPKEKKNDKGIPILFSRWRNVSVDIGADRCTNFVRKTNSSSPLISIQKIQESKQMDRLRESISQQSKMSTKNRFKLDNIRGRKRYQIQNAEYRQSLLRIAFMVRSIVQNLHRREDHQRILLEWKLMAAILDRIQLWIFLVVTVGCTCFLFFNAPRDYSRVDPAEIIKRFSPPS